MACGENRNGRQMEIINFNITVTNGVTHINFRGWVVVIVSNASALQLGGHGMEDPGLTFGDGPESI